MHMIELSEGTRQRTLKCMTRPLAARGTSESLSVAPVCLYLPGSRPIIGTKALELEFPLERFKSNRLTRYVAKYKKCASGDNVQQPNCENANLPHLAREILSVDDCRPPMRLGIGNVQNRIDRPFDR